MKILALLFCVALAGTAAAEVNVAKAYNEFGFKVLAETRKANPNGNIFLSPASLAFALGMVQSGAEGETLKEITRTLQLEGVSPTELNQANQALTEHLSKLDPKIKLEIANSLWTKKGADIKPEFIAVNQKSYGAEVASVDFHDPTTVPAINGWVSEHTHGKITKMVTAPLDPALRLILLDAIYFKGTWVIPFDRKNTHDKPFTLANGQEVKRSRMMRSGNFGYYEDEICQAVELPYAGWDISMYVFLPKKNLDDFLGQLGPENWERWLSQFRLTRGTVELPRVKLADEYDLKKTLAALGMPAAFTSRADFSGISSEPLFISWVRQKTFVEVNEEGTEAAAVTGIGVAASAVHRPTTPFQMVVDRPFFVAIRERQTGSILFLGAIMDPR